MRYAVLVGKCIVAPVYCRGEWSRELSERIPAVVQVTDSMEAAVEDPRGEATIRSGCHSIRESSPPSPGIPTAAGTDPQDTTRRRQAP